MNVKKYMPFGIVCAAAGTLFLSGCGNRNEAIERDEAVAVRTAPVVASDFVRSIVVQGSWVAEEFALVPARIGGTLKEVLVADGATVTNGQPLARVDSEQLEHVVEARRQDVHVARSAVEVARAQAEKAAADLEMAGNDHRRFQALHGEKVITEQTAEHSATQLKAAEAMERVTRAQIALAEAQARQAESALAIAERDLRDTLVRAPLDGVISRRFYELGEMVDNGKPVFRIDNPASLEFSAFLAERHYPAIMPGQTMMRMRTPGEDVKEFVLSYRGPTVHEKLRTFEIKAVWPEPPDWMAPGMMGHAEIILDRRSGQGVPADAVVRRGEQTLVFVVEDGRARAVAVTTGYETGGLVEIVTGLPEGAADVAVTGLHRLRDGDLVTRAGAGR